MSRPLNDASCHANWRKWKQSLHKERNDQCSGQQSESKLRGPSQKWRTSSTLHVCVASFAIGCLYANIFGVTVPHLGISTRLRVLKITTPGVMDIESAIAHEKYPTALEMFSWTSVVSQSCWRWMVSGGPYFPGRITTSIDWRMTLFAFALSTDFSVVLMPWKQEFPII